MKILERYLFTRFLAATLLGLIFFIGLVSLVELFELRDHYDLSPAALPRLGTFLLLRLPFLCYLTAPVALFLAAVFVVAFLSLSAETTAIRAGGVGLIRWTRPVLVFTSVVALGALAGAEFVVAPWAVRADWIKRVEIQKRSPLRADRADLAVSHRENYLLADLYRPEAGLLENVTLVTPSVAHDAPVRIAHWDSIRYDDGAWRSAPEKDTPALALVPPPVVIEHQAEGGGLSLLKERPIETIRLSELLAEIHDLRELIRLGETYSFLEDELRIRLVRTNAKLAFPFTLPPLVLAGILLGARVGRRRGFGTAVAGAVLGAVGYMLMLQLSLRFGEMAARLETFADAAVFFPWVTPVVLAIVVLRLRV